MTTDEPPAPARPDRWRDGGLLVFLAAAAAANFLLTRHYVFEDAYITFRYASNLAAGHGFVFQPGEYVLGTSTPLYTLLLAALGVLGADIPTAGKLVFSLALAGCAWFGFRLLARRGAANSGVVFAVAVALGAGGILPFAGMETALHLALIFLAFLLAAEGKPWATGLALGLLCLNRYDGVVAAGAILLVCRLAAKRWPWREALLSGAIFGTWLLFAQLYFGSPLPNSYAAKVADVPFSEYLFASVEQQARQLLLPLHWVAPVTAKSLFLPLLLALFLPLLWHAGRAMVRREPPAPDLAAPALFALLLWLGYATIGPPLGHTWYLIPASYCVLLLALLAWSRLLAPPAWPPAAARGAALALLAAALLALPWLKLSEAAGMSSVAFGQDRIRAYEDFAGFARRHALENTSVLTLEPGYLTYLSGQRAIDAAGLVTQGIFFHGPLARRDDFAGLLEKYRPELVVPSPPPLSRAPGAAPYLPVLTASPGRELWMRRDFYLGRLDRFYAAWQAGAYGGGKGNAPHHPLATDFGGAASPTFSLRRSRVQKMRGLLLGGSGHGEAYRQPLLTSRGAAGEATAWSETFLIDFDQLDFLFAASQAPAASVRLYVEGLLAAELRGSAGPEGPAVTATLEEVAIPVHGWRGKRGMLVFVSADARKYFFAADRIRSRRWEGRRTLDDFETGAYDPEIWAETWDAAPIDSRRLAALGGLPMAQGRGAAASLFQPGPRRMRSRPFRVDHRRLSFSVFDFGDPRTTIELEVDGQPFLAYRGEGGGRLRLVQWDLAELQGREAVLVLRDDAADAEIGLGIDSIVLHDEAPLPLPHPSGE